MKLFEGCVLASDIDGTLINNNRLCSRNLEAIHRFVQAGGSFCLASGRSPLAARPIAEEIGCVTLSVLYNGGMVYDFSNNAVLSEKTLDPRAKQFLFSLTDRFCEIGAEAYVKTDPYIVHETQEVLDHLAYESLRGLRTDRDSLMRLPWNKRWPYLKMPGAAGRFAGRRRSSAYPVPLRKAPAVSTVFRGIIWNSFRAAPTRRPE